MKKISLLLIGSILYFSFVHAEVIDVSPDGGMYRDRYGAGWNPRQKAPTTDQLGVDGPRPAIAGLSKKKTSDIVIYPTPRN